MNIEEYAFAENKQLVSLEFDSGENELRIEALAFQNCVSLQSFHVSKRLKHFEIGILDGCPNIEQITIDNHHEK